MLDRRLITLVIIILLNLFILISLKSPHNFVASTIYSSTHVFRTLTSRLIYYASIIKNYIKTNSSLSIENKQLRTTLENYETQFKSIEALILENKKLRELLQFSYSIDYELIPAHILLSSLGDGSIEYVIDKGSKRGIDKDMIICAIYNNRLVLLGKISSIQLNSAKFTSIHQKGFSIPVITSESDQVGILEGSGLINGTLKVVFDSLYESKKVFVGEEIYVHGYSTLFPQGIPIGILTDIETSSENLLLNATVEPFINPNKIDVVLVLNKKEAL